jgi:hypothetical protein
MPQAPDPSDLVWVNAVANDPEFVRGEKPGPSVRWLYDRIADGTLTRYEWPPDRRVYVSRTQLRAALAPRARPNLSAPPPA